MTQLTRPKELCDAYRGIKGETRKGVNWRGSIYAGNLEQVRTEVGNLTYVLDINQESIGFCLQTGTTGDLR